MAQSEEQFEERPRSKAAGRARRRRRGGERADAAEANVACPGNTPLHSSQGCDLDELLRASTVAIDWLEIAGAVVWSPIDESPLREQVNTWYENAVAAESALPFTLNERQCLIHPSGLGRGRQSRMTYRVTCGPMTLAYAERDRANRQHSNFVLAVPGKSCLMDGALAVRRWAHQVVQDLGGRFQDEWIRRIDVCIDLPGVDPRKDLLRACHSQHYLSTVEQGHTHFNRDGLTGFTIGSAKRVQLQIYDKLLQVRDKKDPEYLQSIIQGRWKQIPQHATRVELRIGREWLSQWMKYDAETYLENLGSLLEYTLGDSSRPFFKMLAEAPDRENKHQSRTPVLPLWDAIRKKLIAEVGATEFIPQRIKRGEMSLERAYKVIRSMLARAGVLRGQRVTSIEEAQQQLAELHEVNKGRDFEIAQIWVKHRDQLGYTIDVDDFPYTLNQAADVDDFGMPDW